MINLVLTVCKIYVIITINTLLWKRGVTKMMYYPTIRVDFFFKSLYKLYIFCYNILCIDIIFTKLSQKGS